MMIMTRDRDYPALLEAVEGKKVAVWTCNTCARYNGIGGREAAQRLAVALEADGVAVVHLGWTSASCMESSLLRDGRGELPGEADLIVALTCRAGAVLVERVWGVPAINPVITLGPGYLTGDGGRSLVGSDGRRTDADVLAAARGLPEGPIV